MAQPQELPVSHLVPGDVVKLAAGDMIPADVRIVSAKDLFVIQGSLTGESFPVEKFEVDTGPAGASRRSSWPTWRSSARASKAARRWPSSSRPDDETYLGSMAESLAEQPTADRVRQGRRAVHVAHAPLHPRHGAVGLRHQRPDEGQLARGVLLRAGRRRGAHARDAADDRHGLPVQGRHGDGQARRSSSSGSTPSRTSARWTCSARTRPARSRWIT